MSDSLRRLQVEFATREEFQREYKKNLAKGGLFVACTETFAVNEPVSVDVKLLYCNEVVTLAGEVVHCISPQMSGAGGTPGAAVQLSAPASELRSILEPLAGVSANDDELDGEAGKRDSVRSEAVAPVTLLCADGTVVEGRTRNISDTGMLVSVRGEVVEVGAEVEASLVHPKTGEQTTVGGTVMRHVKSESGEVMALGIRFRTKPGAKREFTDFLGTVRAAEHSRRLGGISGAISELGIHSLLHMFATYSPQGSLRLTRGPEEGLLLFDSGLVRGAQLGELRDGKALAELLSWTEGNFEFIGRADESAFGKLSMRVDDAVRAALVGDDADADDDVEIPTHSPSATLSILGSADGAPLDKTELAIVDLARVGMKVGKIIAVIPEPADKIHLAIHGLMERGLIMLSE